jgi:hypothetical protein
MGYQRVENSSPIFTSAKAGMPSRKRKIKISRTKTIAEYPQVLTTAVIMVSLQLRDLFI